MKVCGLGQAELARVRGEVQEIIAWIDCIFFFSRLEEDWRRALSALGAPAAEPRGRGQRVRDGGTDSCGITCGQPTWTRPTFGPSWGRSG